MTGRGRLFAGAAELARPLFDGRGREPFVAVVDSSFSMLHGLYWVINNLTEEGPVLVAVDDLQWADAASLRFLNFLDARGSTACGSRCSRPHGRRKATAPSRHVSRPGPRLGSYPGALSLAATAALCSRRLGPRCPTDFAAACREATGGNPFLLESPSWDIAARRAPPMPRVRSVSARSVRQPLPGPFSLRLSGRPPAAPALDPLGRGAWETGRPCVEAAKAAGLPERGAVVRRTC